MFPWDEFDTVIFERGLSLRKQSGSSWSCQLSTTSLTVESPQAVAEQFGLRLVVAIGPRGSVRPNLVLPATQGRLLDMYRSELSKELPLSVIFAMGAMLYRDGPHGAELDR